MSATDMHTPDGTDTLAALPPDRSPDATDDVAERVLEHLFRFRRLSDPTDRCGQQPCPACFAQHRPTVQAFVDAQQPIHFVVLAFPAKSPNRNKVLGRLPDLAERIAIDFLQSLCEHIGHYHRPGARITICSDGHVFGDLVGVSDADISDYRRALAHIISQTGASSIDLYGLEDAFHGPSHQHMRDELQQRYATSLDELHHRVSTDPASRALFNGIHRFMVEDQSALRTGVSKSRLRKDCKDLAYRVILRSNAWSALVAERFPGALRLSIHPQPAHAEKIGLHLVRTRDNWLTPWHGVMVDTGESLRLMKRSDAERMNASIVWRNHRPSHFVAPHLPHTEQAS